MRTVADEIEGLERRPHHWGDKRYLGAMNLEELRTGHDILVAEAAQLNTATKLCRATTGQPRACPRALDDAARAVNRHRKVPDGR